jgi:cytochrome bd ubiquinol oxidase subunit I
VIGTTLAMEGMFAFFAESVFLGIFLAGRERVSARVHYVSAIFVFLGSWLSGFFIIATNAWMRPPGRLLLDLLVQVLRVKRGAR